MAVREKKPIDAVLIATVVCLVLSCPEHAVQAQVVRDDMGIPHISARTYEDLYELFGYTTAQDRLWQLEFFKRDARGTLAELRAEYLDADINRRLFGYTEAELRLAFASMDPHARLIIQAYVSGINRRISEVMTNTAQRLPFEFKQLAITPSHWTVTDQLAVTSALYRRFGTNGGRELANLAILENLMSWYDEATAWGMFNDLLWPNDPQAHVNIDKTTGIGPDTSHYTLPDAHAAALYLQRFTGVQAAAIQHQRLLHASAALRLPLLYQRASFFLAVAGKHTQSGNPILSGNPQPGLQPLPAVFYEAHLRGPGGFEALGVAVPGQPAIILGHNRNIAWSTNVGAGDNVDIYMETLNPDNHQQYFHDGKFIDLEKRLETFNVAGQPPVTVPVYRTVHGPVISPAPFDPDDPDIKQIYSWKSAHWLLDTTITAAQLAQSEAADIQQFDATMENIFAAFHYAYADRSGNIAYWAAGRVPIRPDGSDSRLPLLGGERQEWTGQLAPIPKALNPEKGYITGWNTKPTPQFNNSDSKSFGPFHRTLWLDKFLTQQLGGGEPFTVDTVQRILLDMGKVGQGVGHTNAGILIDRLVPFLDHAITAVLPADAQLDGALKLLSDWDGLALDDVLTSTAVNTAQVLFDAWLTRLIVNTFQDEFQDSQSFDAYSDQHFNMLLHALDGSDSPVPPSRDYFDDMSTPDKIETVDDIIVASMREALQDLSAAFGTADTSQWIAPRPATPILHLGPPALGEIRDFPGFNTGIYSFISELVPRGRYIEPMTRLPYGQSGFIGVDAAGKPDFDQPHLLDRLDPWRNYKYSTSRLE